MGQSLFLIGAIHSFWWQRELDVRGYSDGHGREDREEYGPVLQGMCICGSASLARVLMPILFHRTGTAPSTTLPGTSRVSWWPRQQQNRTSHVRACKSLHTRWAIQVMENQTCKVTTVPVACCHSLPGFVAVSTITFHPSHSAAESFYKQSLEVFEVSCGEESEQALKVNFLFSNNLYCQWLQSLSLTYIHWYAQRWLIYNHVTNVYWHVLICAAFKWPWFVK